MGANFLNLISYGAYGIKVANYNKIRETLVEKFKEIYGSDIDLSSTSADGQWIEQQALLFNNMLQLIKQLYANIDPREATGEFLDIISSYTNVMRRPPTKSSVYVNIIGLEPSRQYPVNDPLVLIDRNGDTWTCVPFTADSSGEATVLTVCDEYGPVRADIGWIHSTLEQLPGVTITMTSEALVGRNRETDNELRARRDNSLSIKGVSVVESLTASLLDIVGIEDVLIYNNDTTGNITARDGTVIAKNSIYILLKRNKNLFVDDSVIGSIIYEKKTPGIGTISMENFNFSGGSPTLDSIPKRYNYPNLLGIDQYVYWKEVEFTDNNITIEIKISPKEYYVSGSGEGSTAKEIYEAVKEYLDGIKLGDNLSHAELLSEVFYADPLYRGRTTYNIKYVKINNVEEDYENKDSYFKVNNLVVAPDGNDFKLTITYVP